MRAPEVPPGPDLVRLGSGPRSRWHPGAWPWKRLGSDTGAALIVGLAAVSFFVSSAGLMFQGALAPHLPAAIGAALLGGALLTLASVWRGSLPLATAGTAPSTVAVLAAITAGIAAGAPPGAALPTAVAALALTAAATGVTWWLMGRFGWGGFIRYVPYPVIGGFMGATGWLIAAGGLGVATGQAFSGSVVLGWLGGTADARLAAGAGLGVFLWLVGQRYRHPLVLPLLLLGAALAMHAGLAAAGIDLQAARRLGWLQAPFDAALPVWPLQPSLAAAVQWELLLAQSGLMLSCIIMSTLSLLLTSSSLELLWNARADLNRDLRVLGKGNLLAAAAGGLTGSLSLSRSILNRDAGARSRASGVVLALLCLAAMVWGGPVIALVPLPLLGGLLLAQGLDMLKDWLVDSRQHLSRRDHLTVVAVVAVTVVLGFLPAVCLGVLACCVDFAVAQAQFPPVRRLLTRAGWLSSVERPAAQAEWLMRQGGGLQIVELQGVLFFGSATRLSQEIEAVLQAPAAPQHLLFDFRHVRTLDSSAAQALARLFRTAEQQGTHVELSGLHETHTQLLRAAGARVAPQHLGIETAVAAWDESMLATREARAAAAGERHDADGIEATLTRQLGPALAARLLPAFETLTLAPGSLLFERGAPSDALYLVASGRLAAVVPAGGEPAPGVGSGTATRAGSDDPSTRASEADSGVGSGVTPRAAPAELTVRIMLPGSMVGEMGLFRQQPRSASVRAVGASVVLKLGAARLAMLEAEDPAAAAALYRLFVLQMASRLDQLTLQAQLASR